MEHWRCSRVPHVARLSLSSVEHCPHIFTYIWAHNVCVGAGAASVSMDKEKVQIVVRTTNRKYFKRIDGTSIPPRERHSMILHRTSTASD